MALRLPSPPGYVIIRGVRKVLLALIFFTLSGSLNANSEWSGVWRILRVSDGKVESINQLFIRFEGEEIQLEIYQDEARPITLQGVKFRLDDNYLEVQGAASEKQPLPMLYKFSRSGENITGTWTFTHMQMAMSQTGELQGSRIFSDANWGPWLDVELHRDSRFIDLGTTLARQAPLDDFPKFVEFWTSEVERNFYFPLQLWTYGKGLDPAEHKQRALRGLFDRLQSEKLREHLPRQAEMASRVLRVARFFLGEENLTFFLISLPGASEEFDDSLWSRVPTPEEEGNCACKLDLRERFIFFDAEKWLNAPVTGPVFDRTRGAGAHLVGGA